MYEKLIYINSASLLEDYIYNYIKCFKASSKDKSLPDLDNKSSARTLHCTLYMYYNLAAAPA